MLDILRKNPFPKFHVDAMGLVSVYDNGRRIPTKLMVSTINKMIPKRQRRVSESTSGYTIATGVVRCGNSVMLHDIIESDRSKVFTFRKTRDGYIYQFYSGRKVLISLACGEQLFKDESLTVTRDDIIAFLVNRNYGIEI